MPKLQSIPGGRSPEGERQLLREGFHAGDRRAYEALVREHVDTVFTVCLRMTRNRAEAEDVAQDALVKAMQRHAAYDPSRPFRPWLLKVTVNLCRDRIRTVWWRRVLPFGETLVLDDPKPNPERVVGDQGRDALVRSALQTLPPIYREALALYHLEDMRYREISEITGVAVPALKQRVRRGSMLLREKITAMYPELVPTRTIGD